MRILISIVVKKGLKTCMFAAENSKQVMWTSELYTGISNVYKIYVMQSTWPHRLEEMGFVLGFIYLDILDRLESFESIQMNLLSKLGWSQD